MKFSHLQASLGIFAISALLSGVCFGKEQNNPKEKVEHSERRCFKHNIQLQLSDGYGFPVAGTQFWVPIEVIHDGSEVTLILPLINFQTGPVASEDHFHPAPGGYLYTSDGFLPSDVRPNDLVYRSTVAASNNGLSLPFSFSQPTSTLPTPPNGYILSVTNAGALVVQCTGTFGNLIPQGPQVMMPCSITYTIKPKEKLCENFKISTGFTNTTQFTNALAANISLRDHHVNAACGGRVAWAWSDNSNIPDKTNNTLNLMVAVGKIRKDGTLKVYKPVQLTNLPAGSLVGDTAIAINPKDPKNIVVSWETVVTNVSVPYSNIYRAVSFDGGKKWPYNGLVSVQPTGVPTEAGDCRGVAFDKFGGCWYLYTNLYDSMGNEINTPTFAYSGDKGINFQNLFTLSPLPPRDQYDYPQYCFGGDGQGQYGLHFVVDAEIFAGSQRGVSPVVGFVPITDLNQIGTPSYVQLTSLINNNILADITASNDGRVWFQGTPYATRTYVGPLGIVFKSPGALDMNYAGPWHMTMYNGLSIQWAPKVPALQDSQPIRGYLPESIQSILYDDKRQALYALPSVPVSRLSQNMHEFISSFHVITGKHGQIRLISPRPILQIVDSSRWHSIVAQEILC